MYDLVPVLEQKPSAVYFVYTEHGYARNAVRAMKPALQEYPGVKLLLVHEDDKRGEDFIRFGIIVKGIMSGIDDDDPTQYRIGSEAIPEVTNVFREMFKTIDTLRKLVEADEKEQAPGTQNL